MSVDSPGSEDAFGKAVLTGPTDVIHDLVPSILNDSVANTRGDRVECFVPRGAFPLSLAASSRAFEWKENAIGIRYLVECRRTLGAVAPTRPRMFRIPLKLLHLARDLVDVREQAAR